MNIKQTIKILIFIFALGVGIVSSAIPESAFAAQYKQSLMRLTMFRSLKLQALQGLQIKSKEISSVFKRSITNSTQC